MVLQSYESEAGNEYVIRGNGALVKCGIPSYVADLVAVDAWIDDHGRTHRRFPDDSNSFIGSLPLSNRSDDVRSTGSPHPLTKTKEMIFID